MIEMKTRQIIDALNKQGMTDLAIADYLKVSYTTVYKWKKGRNANFATRKILSSLIKEENL